MTTDTLPATAHMPLPRLTRNEAQARSALAQRAQACTVQWGGQPWQLTLRPLPDLGPMALDAGEWHVSAQWAGAPFEFALPAPAAQAWVAVQAGSDVPALPDEFAAAALESALAELLAALERLQRGPAQIDAISRDAGASLGQPHVFEFEAASAHQVLRGRLATGTLGLMLMAGLVARLPAAGRSLPAADLPMLLRAEVGWTWLSPSELATLAVGGAVMVEHTTATPDSDLWLGGDGWGVRVRSTDTGLTVTTAFTQLELTMPPTPSPANADAPTPIEQLPLRLAFDLGERTLTLGELQSLQVGQALDLGRPLSSAVSLRVNGAMVGTGELVEIDGRLGVTITALAAR